VPVSDATQWDQVERVADWVYPVFVQLQFLAAQVYTSPASSPVSLRPASTPG
jgi:hypothetical protein